MSVKRIPMSNKLILHLGGGLVSRAKKSSELAKQFPEVSILVSSEGDNQTVLNEYLTNGIDASRVVIDNEALDTVTNFTSTFKRIKNEFKADIVYVVTNGFHMRRTMLVAEAVFYNSGIIPIASPSSEIEFDEPFGLIIGDTIRAWVWKLTGLLFYSKQVKLERRGTDKPDHWYEIGI